jgi:hypothetical protein
LIRGNLSHKAAAATLPYPSCSLANHQLEGEKGRKRERERETERERERERERENISHNS